MAQQSGKPRDFVQLPPTSWLDPVDITRTGLQTFLAGLFGSFADKREVLAALYPIDDTTPAFDYRKDENQQDRKDVWFDYICDTGDGWNPTYSIACLVAEDWLKVDGVPDKLPRGEFMVLGGDQVYPVASVQGYRDRLEGPFFAACATSEDRKERKPVYALPGNHDWYDGLTSFIRLFCQGTPDADRKSRAPTDRNSDMGRWVGQWTATQTRSYFAIQLPHRWWIWGLDVQLESDLDVPQVKYFKHYAQLLQPGDCVILVSPEPTWIEAGRPGPDKSGEGNAQAHRNMVYLEGLIKRRGASVPIKIAGDLHHYARYQGDKDKNSQLITCGGGGAFLHGTFGLPKVLDLRDSTKQTFTQQTAVPTEDESKSLRGSVMWKLLRRNPWFAVAVGGIYWLYSWLLQSASEALNTDPWKDMGLLEYLRVEACPSGQFLCRNVFWAWFDIVVRDPRLFVFTALIVVGCGTFAYAFRRPGSSGLKSWTAFSIGCLHGFAHIMLALILMKLVARCIPVDLLVHMVALPAGAIPGSLLMAAYLWLANVLVDTHDQEVLSTQGIEDYKCFARFHVTREIVTIYPIGLKTVCTKWKVAEGVTPTKPKERWFPRRKTIYSNLRVPLGTKRVFEPDGEGLAPRLLEKEPIKVCRPPPA